MAASGPAAAAASIGADASQRLAATLDRIGGALWGLYIADAMSMPSHWYYGGQGQIARDYGRIDGYKKPVMDLPGSIMNKSNTGGGGRGSASGDIIGRVINHGKKDYWNPRKNCHYHCTLEAGENTLEAQLVRLVCRCIGECEGDFVADELRRQYIEFMTTPGSHNDCYASTCHRMFFANLQRGLPPEECPDNDGHNVDTIDGLAMTVPVILAGWQLPLPQVQQRAAECAGVTRSSSVLGGYAGNFASVLRAILEGQPVKEAMSTYAGRGLESVVRGARSRPDPVVA